MTTKCCTVGDPQEALQAKRAGGVDHLKDLVLRDDFGERDNAGDLGLLEDFPVSGAGGSVEELDGREDDALGARGGFNVNDLVQEVNAYVILGEFLRRRFVEIGELAYFPDVAVDGPFLHPREPIILFLCGVGLSVAGYVGISNPPDFDALPF